LFGAVLLLCAVQVRSAAEALSPSYSPGPLTVEDFGLFDHEGSFYRLHYYDRDPETKAIVLFVQGNGCPLVRKRIPVLARLQSEYASAGVRFFMINVNLQDERDDVAKEARAYEIPMPILMDDTQFVGRALRLERTAEVLVIDPRGWQIAYRGAIDDQLDYEAVKPGADRAYLAEALDAVLAGKPVPLARTDSPGCRISYEEPPSAWTGGEAYREVVAPLVLNHCVPCHRPGGVAPFALSSHRKLRGWADMIREVVMTRRMPPWQADPHYGEFANDFSLTTEEQRVLLHGLDAGLPHEGGEDPLSGVKAPASVWARGEPDHILGIPEQSVPAEGVIDYRYLTFDSPFGIESWVRAVEVRPGNVEVLHHLIAYVVFDRDGEEQRRWLAAYAPGMEAEEFPAGSAIRIRSTDRLLIELHYTASGRAVTDRSEVGLYLAGDAPQVPLRTGIFMDQDIRIPPHARAHAHRQEVPVERDVVLFSLFPHMHFRGKSMRFTLRAPGGVSEILLSVPYYSFNWQRGYSLLHPKLLRAGSVLVLEASWDNSDLNPANPDPDRTVTWGEQSFDEMFFATYRYVDARAWQGRSESGASTAGVSATASATRDTQ